MFQKRNLTLPSSALGFFRTGEGMHNLVLSAKQTLFRNFYNVLNSTEAMFSLISIVNSKPQRTHCTLYHELELKSVTLLHLCMHSCICLKSPLFTWDILVIPESPVHIVSHYFFIIHSKFIHCIRAVLNFLCFCASQVLRTFTMPISSWYTPHHHAQAWLTRWTLTTSLFSTLILPSNLSFWSSFPPAHHGPHSISFSFSSPRFQLYFFLLDFFQAAQKIPIYHIN